VTKNSEIFYQLQAQTTPYPLGLEIERAEGVYLYDIKGKQYLDLISGIAVSNIGYNHPKVIQVIKSQLDKYLHVMPYGEYILAPQTQLASKLNEVLPENLNCTYFVNSGTEANEGALKLAKRFTGRTEIIACKQSYHGSTHGSLSVTGNENKKYAFRPLLPDIKFMEFNNPEELPFISSKTAAVIVEPIQGDAGVRIPSSDYLTKLRVKCTESGTLLIFDEVQTGFGRTGKLFAFEHFGVIPDILTLAKAMGGGMPIGAFVSSKDIMSTLTHDPELGHITTFGGNPVCCTAALANLNIILEENLLDQVETKGRLFEELLIHPKIKAFRRIGLMMAVEFENQEIVQKVVKKCLENGVVCFWFLSCPESFRLAPPLIISEEQIRKGCEVIMDAIDGC